MKLTKRQFLQHAVGVAGLATLPLQAAAERYQLGCQTLPYRAFPLSRALEGIRKAGYRDVMPYPKQQQDKPCFVAALSPSERAVMKRQFKDAGLTPFMAFAGHEVELTAPEGVEKFCEDLDLAADFGIKTVVGFGPWYYVKWPDVPKPALEWEKECNEFYSALEQGVRHAESVGVTVTLKPHTGITGTAAACSKLLKRVASDHLRICWDAGNVAFYEGLNPDPGLPELAPYVKSVCIKDHRGGRAAKDFPIPGTGDIDHQLMFRTLFAGGFSGPLAVERVDGTGGPVTAEILDQRLAQAYNFLAPLLAKTSRG